MTEKDTKTKIISPTKMTGWLRKESHDMLRRLQKRYFVLDAKTKTLTYYSSDSLNKEKKGEYTFTLFSVCESLADAHGQNNSFVLRGSRSSNADGNKVDLQLIAEDPDEKLKWIDHITRAIHGESFEYNTGEEIILDVDSPIAGHENCWNIFVCCCDHDNELFEMVRESTGLRSSSIYRMSHTMNASESDNYMKGEVNEYLDTARKKLDEYNSTEIAVSIGAIKSLSDEEKLKAARNLITALERDKKKLDEDKHSVTRAVIKLGGTEALLSICKDRDKTPELKSMVAAIIANMLDGFDEAKVVMGRAAGVAALTGLIKANVEGYKYVNENAAKAIVKIIDENPVNTVSLLTDGGIEELIDIIGSNKDTAKAKEWAARALWFASYSYGDEISGEEKIKKANGATVLVDMIRDASTEEGKKCSIAALGNIANKCAVGANGSRALPLLMNVLKNNTEYSIATRTHAARAVINIGRKDGEVKSSVKGEYKTIVEEANKEAKHVGGDFQKQVRGLYFY